MALVVVNITVALTLCYQGAFLCKYLDCSEYLDYEIINCIVLFFAK
jgi:hypothetical protein